MEYLKEKYMIAKNCLISPEDSFSSIQDLIQHCSQDKQKGMGSCKKIFFQWPCHLGGGGKGPAIKRGNALMARPLKEKLVFGIPKGSNRMNRH